MKKKFEIGINFENNTEYYAEEKIYDIYAKDAKIVSDHHYSILRTHSTPEFLSFVELKNKKNITIDFCGATLMFHDKIQPFILDNCENITIKNCVINYSRPPFTECEIIEVNNDSLKVKVVDGCTYRIENGTLIPTGETWENKNLENGGGMFFQLFDKKTKKGKGLMLGCITKNFVPDPSRPWKVYPYIAEQDGEFVILKGEILEHFKPGLSMVITHEKRDLSNCFVYECKNISIENYRILAGYGMGIYCFRTENINIDRYLLKYDETSPYVVTNAADALHTFACSGDFKITNSSFEGMIDDAINIHSNFHTVDSCKDNVIIADIASCELEAGFVFNAGDKIAVYNGPSMEQTGEYTIIKAEEISERIRKFTLDKPVANHKKGDLIEDLSGNADVTIKNCKFGMANTHLRLQSRGKFVITDCECELEIMLSGDASYWFESSPITDLTIKNTKFTTEPASIYISSEIMPTEKAPYYHKNIKITNCEFYNQTPLWGGYADNITFTDNTNSRNLPMQLILTNCGALESNNCEVVRKTEIKTELKPN